MTGDKVEKKSKKRPIESGEKAVVEKKKSKVIKPALDKKKDANVPKKSKKTASTTEKPKAEVKKKMKKPKTNPFIDSEAIEDNEEDPIAKHSDDADEYDNDDSSDNFIDDQPVSTQANYTDVKEKKKSSKTQGNEDETDLTLEEEEEEDEDDEDIDSENEETEIPKKKSQIAKHLKENNDDEENLESEGEEEEEEEEEDYDAKENDIEGIPDKEKLKSMLLGEDLLGYCRSHLRGHLNEPSVITLLCAVNPVLRLELTSLFKRLSDCRMVSRRLQEIRGTSLGATPDDQFINMIRTKINGMLNIDEKKVISNIFYVYKQCLKTYKKILTDMSTQSALSRAKYIHANRPYNSGNRTNRFVLKKKKSM